MIEDIQSRLRKMRERYVERVRIESSRLEEIVESMNGEAAGEVLDEIQRLAHGLAGSAGTFGFEEIGARAAELERVAAIVRRGGAATPSMTDAVRGLSTAVSRIAGRTE